MYGQTCEREDRYVIDPPEEDLDHPTWICTFDHIQAPETCTCPSSTGPRRVTLNINEGHVDSLGCATCGLSLPAVGPLDVNASGFTMTLTEQGDYGEGKWWKLSDPGPYEYPAKR